MTTTIKTDKIFILIPKEYHTLPTHQLIQKIVNDTDPAALQCFLTKRRIFQHHGQNLILSEYLNQLRENKKKKEPESCEIADTAYDRTLNKFLSLPGTTYEIHENTKRPPVDCRKYYRSFLNAFHRQNQFQPLGEIGAEHATATLLGGLVWRHYRLSIIDARRINDPTGRRYQWKTPQGNFNLRVPRNITSGKIKEWLEQHFLQVESNKPIDQATIQSAINARFLFPTHIDTENLTVPTNDHETLIDSIDGLGHRLATAVIEEKMKNFNHLRPTLKTLGGATLRALILDCLQRLIEGTFNLRQIANTFNIPLATMSQIAGPNWREKEKPRIPDLWQNVAVVISQDPLFHDAREEAGISQEEILESLTTIPARKERKK